LGSKSVWYI